MRKKNPNSESDILLTTFFSSVTSRTPDIGQPRDRLKPSLCPLRCRAGNGVRPPGGNPLCPAPGTGLSARLSSIRPTPLFTAGYCPQETGGQSPVRSVHNQWNGHVTAGLCLAVHHSAMPNWFGIWNWSVYPDALVFRTSPVSETQVRQSVCPYTEHTEHRLCPSVHFSRRPLSTPFPGHGLLPWASVRR